MLSKKSFVRLDLHLPHNEKKSQHTVFIPYFPHLTEISKRLFRCETRHTLSAVSWNGNKISYTDSVGKEKVNLRPLWESLWEPEGSIANGNIWLDG